MPLARRRNRYRGCSRGRCLSIASRWCGRGCRGRCLSIAGSRCGVLRCGRRRGWGFGRCRWACIRCRSSSGWLGFGGRGRCWLVCGRVHRRWLVRRRLVGRWRCRLVPRNHGSGLISSGRRRLLVRRYLGCWVRWRLLLSGRRGRGFGSRRLIGRLGNLLIVNSYLDGWVLLVGRGRCLLFRLLLLRWGRCLLLGLLFRNRLCGWGFRLPLHTLLTFAPAITRIAGRNGSLVLRHLLLCGIMGSGRFRLRLSRRLVLGLRLVPGYYLPVRLSGWRGLLTRYSGGLPL